MPKRMERSSEPTRLVQLAPGTEFVMTGRVLRHGSEMYPWVTVALGRTSSHTLPPGTQVEPVKE